MNITLKKALRKPTAADTIYLIKVSSDLRHVRLTTDERDYVKKKHREKKNVVIVNKYKYKIIVVYGLHSGTRTKKYEHLRKCGSEAQEYLNEEKIERAVVQAINASKNEIYAFVEGALLGNYQYTRYLSGERLKNLNTLTELNVYCKSVTNNDLHNLENVIMAVYKTRDLVNTPVYDLNAEQLAEEFVKMGKESGFKVEVLNKSKIESLKMGGLLAVNKGSIDPPTFTIMEWKPKNHKTKKPLVLVGKGVVYDTGGLSLKPSNFMDTMKSDMAGAAAVGGAMYAIAAEKLPYWVVGLVPATDNRPNGNAYAPGDVIKMYDGTTVEVLNTDAEGRMILADALAYAKKYEPELVIDIATLTGSAVRAIGNYAIVGMNSKADDYFDILKKTGTFIHERIVEFPFWDEYKEQLKSEIADLKNIGGPDAGAITAGKFLEHFTDFPYIHLDIAGPSFLTKRDSYNPAGGTGVGVRLFFEFVKSLS